MTDRDMMLDQLEQLFDGPGAVAYLGEPVTVAEHMLQCAALAQTEGASDALVAAALLHDIGHLVGDDGAYREDDTVDRHHDQVGAQILADLFPPVVAACVRLHVGAKRYLCATDPAYGDRLSPASRHSLSLQGGAMQPAEVLVFTSEPFHREAVAVRRWDDAGKVSGMAVPPFYSFRPLLQCLKTHSACAQSLR